MYMPLIYNLTGPRIDMQFSDFTDVLRKTNTVQTSLGQYPSGEIRGHSITNKTLL